MRPSHQPAPLVHLDHGDEDGEDECSEKDSTQHIRRVVHGEVDATHRDEGDQGHGKQHDEHLQQVRFRESKHKVGQQSEDDGGGQSVTARETEP